MIRLPGSNVSDIVLELNVGMVSAEVVCLPRESRQLFRHSFLYLYELLLGGFRSGTARRQFLR